MIIHDFADLEKAYKKAENPSMTLDGNPLVQGRDAYYKEKVVENNMEKLRCDARRRNGIHGNVYAGMMSTRYKGA